MGGKERGTGLMEYDESYTQAQGSKVHAISSTRWATGLRIVETKLQVARGEAMVQDPNAPGFGALRERSHAQPPRETPYIQRETVAYEVARRARSKEGIGTTGVNTMRMTIPAHEAGNRVGPEWSSRYPEEKRRMASPQYQAHALMALSGYQQITVDQPQVVVSQQVGPQLPAPVMQT